MVDMYVLICSFNQWRELPRDQSSATCASAISNRTFGRHKNTEARCKPSTQQESTNEKPPTKSPAHNFTTMTKATPHLTPGGHTYENAASRRSKCHKCAKHIHKGCRRVGLEQFDTTSHKFIYHHFHTGCLDDSIKRRLRFKGGRTLDQEMARQDAAAQQREETLCERKELFEQLMELRSALVRHHEIRLFELHLTDKTIEELVLRLPTNFQQLAKVWGMGPTNMELLGDGILELIGYYLRRREHESTRGKENCTERTSRGNTEKREPPPSEIDPTNGAVAEPSE